VPRIIANWDERALLLLGVLMTQSQHGYQINDFIENALCRVADMKKGPPTPVAMPPHGGMVDIASSRSAIAPGKVYTITDAGGPLHACSRQPPAVEAPTYAATSA